MGALSRRVALAAVLGLLAFRKPAQQLGKARRQWVFCDRLFPFAQQLPDREAILLYSCSSYLLVKTILF